MFIEKLGKGREVFILSYCLLPGGFNKFLFIKHKFIYLLIKNWVLNVHAIFTRIVDHILDHTENLNLKEVTRKSRKTLMIP